MSCRFLAVVNPAAGGERCGRLARPALERLRAAGVNLEIVESQRAGEATRLARDAYAQGYRKFIAVGGDGTSYEIVNGLFPEVEKGERAALGFLPLGTGNSFLREFTERGAEHSVEGIVHGRQRACDVVRLKHGSGTIYYLNLLSMGFTADVAALTNRRLKRLGEVGYLLGVLVCLARLRRRAFPLRVDNDREFDGRRCLFLSFNNSKFTGGKMMIAPLASTSSGRIEYVRCGPVGRMELIRSLHRLYDGSYLSHPQVSRRDAKEIEFALSGPLDVMVDGEVLTLDCRRLDVLPGALDVMV